MAAPSRLVRVLPSLGDVAFLMPLVLVFGGLGGAHALLADGDTGWHVRAGEWMLAHGAIPRQDLFSFTRPEGAWCAWEWGAEVVMAWLARHGGMAAVVLAALVALSFTFTLLYRLLRERTGNALIAIGLTAVAVAGSSIHWLARPHLATLLLIVLYLRILESGRRLWLLAVLMVAWTNLHAGFVFGLLLVAIWAIGDRTGGDRRPYWMALAGCLAATLVNPFLWHLHAHILRYLAGDAWQFNHISEFLSPSFHHSRALYFELMLALGLASVPWHLARRRWHYALLLVGAGHMALVSARHIPIFLIVAAPAVAVAVSEWLRAAQAASVPQRLREMLAAVQRMAAEVGSVDRQASVPVSSLLAGLVVAAALYAPAPGPQFRAEFDPRAFPARAVEMLRRGPASARIFTSDQWGDYLIYRLYPRIRVFVDGRSDFYGSEVEQTCQDVLNVRYDWQQQLGRYRVDTVLLPAEAPLAGALKESGRWRVVYDDASALVFRAAAAEGEPVSGHQVAAVEPPESRQFTLRSELK